MKIVAFIPIKLNNERFPGKNIKEFYDGTPLIHFMQRTLLEVNAIDEIYVFCSDEKVKSYILDGVRLIKRPETLDSSSTKSQDIIKAFMNAVEADIYITAHITSPFISKEHITECVEAVKSGKHDSSFMAELVREFLWDANGNPINFDPANIPRTQDLPRLYSESTGCYVFTKEMFLKLNRRVGDNPHITIISGSELTDIDYPEDFEIANSIYKNILIRGIKLNAEN
jgi:CMP-N-acetylneuraminic acid synthetase